MTGLWQSIKTPSKRCRPSMSKASCPSQATLTTMPARFSTVNAISRLMGLSSTSRIRAAQAGLVTRVNSTRYQVPDGIRSSLLYDPSRTDAVLQAAIAGLRQVGADPERLLDLLVEAGQIAEAVLVYWHAVALVNMGRVEESLPLFRRVFAMDPSWAVLTPRLPKSGLLPDDPKLIGRITREAEVPLAPSR